MAFTLGRVIGALKRTVYVRGRKQATSRARAPAFVTLPPCPERNAPVSGHRHKAGTQPRAPPAPSFVPISGAPITSAVYARWCCGVRAA